MRRLRSQRKRPRPEPRRITEGSVKAAPSGFPDDSSLGGIGDKCIAVSQLLTELSSNVGLNPLCQRVNKDS